nr:MAG TPA: hypothetical protein [Herelleviridae sp.]
MYEITDCLTIKKLKVMARPNKGTGSAGPKKPASTKTKGK